MIPHGAELHFQWPGALELLVRTTLILAAAWLTHFALGGVNPRWRVTLWRAVLVSLLLLPVISAVTPSYPVRLSREVVQMGEYFLPLGAQGSEDGFQTPGEQGIEIESGFRRAFPWFTAFWLSGVFLSLLTVVWTHWRLKRLVNSSRQVDEPARGLLTGVAREVGYGGSLPDLRFSPEVEVPFACGVVKPAVVIPERMLAPDYSSELPAILAHEISHLRSADLVWNILAQVLHCLLWFHPLARLLPGAHRAACEDVCNAAAAEYVGDVGAYSKTLARVALATLNSPLMHGGIPMASRATVLRRLDFLKKGIAARPLPKIGLVGFVMLSFIALAGMSSLSLALAAEQDKVPPLVDTAGYHYKANDGLQPPILKNESRPRPEPSTELRKAVEQAVEKDGNIAVEVEIFVDETGVVNRKLSRIVTPSTCPAWDKSVMENCFEDEYYPALIDGKPVKYKSTSWLGVSKSMRKTSKQN